VRINEAIKAEQLRVIGPDGSQVGVLSRADALLEAEKHGLDLVEISPNTTPPVARIVDWGKYNYQKIKEQQRSRRNAKNVDIKQINMSLRIGQHDLAIKCRKIRDFLSQGHKVKIMLVFRGREMAHVELGNVLLGRVLEELGDAATVDQSPQMAGKSLSILVRSNTSAKDKVKDKDA